MVREGSVSIIPDNPEEFLDWIEEHKPKWNKKDDFKTLKNILCTNDGLGIKAKEKALEAIIKLCCS
jgi:hypothetical protein